MRIFIDTANLKEIEEASTFPFVKGVTTNPSLIAKEGLNQKDVITKITEMIDGPISAEVTAETYDDMLKQAHDLYDIDPSHIVIKLPMTIEGLRVCKKLYEEKIPTNVTLCFSPEQALLAFESRATYVSPFLGRMDDNGFSARDLLGSIMTIKNNYGYKTQIIAASIRNLKHVELAADLECDISTIPYKVLMKMIEHPLTKAGLEKFKEDSLKPLK